MGMFDSMYDRQGDEWQTKAFGCELARFGIGEILPHPRGVAFPAPRSYQVRVFGGPRYEDPEDGYATIRDGELDAVPDSRAEHLPLIDYHGGWAVEPTKD